MNTHTYTLTNWCMHSYVNVHIYHTQTYMYKHAHTKTHTLIYTHRYTHMCTHTHS